MREKQGHAGIAVRQQIKNRHFLPTTRQIVENNLYLT
jgi:hypothetical protein